MFILVHCAQYHHFLPALRSRILGKSSLFQSFLLLLLKAYFSPALCMFFCLFPSCSKLFPLNSLPFSISIFGGIAVCLFLFFQSFPIFYFFYSFWLPSGLLGQACIQVLCCCVSCVSYSSSFSLASSSSCCIMCISCASCISLIFSCNALI